MPSLFSSVASRSRGISTCVKGGVTDCKHWFWVKLALISSISTFTIAVDVVMQFGKRHETTDTTDLLRTCYSLSTLSQKSDPVAEKCDCTVAEKWDIFPAMIRWFSLTFVRQSPVSATVWTGLYGITLSLMLQTCYGLVNDTTGKSPTCYVLAMGKLL